MLSLTLCDVVQDWKLEHGTIRGFPGATETDEDLLEGECDILLPCAKEKVCYIIVCFFVRVPCISDIWDCGNKFHELSKISVFKICNLSVLFYSLLFVNAFLCFV